MGLKYDLENMSLQLITVENIEVLNKRGAYPIIKNGKIKGFTDLDGVPIIMYK